MQEYQSPIIIDKDLYLNDVKIKKEKIIDIATVNCGNEAMDADFFKETLPNGKDYIVVYRSSDTMMNTDKFTVPKNRYFFMGDNRDCSKDSRFLSSVGYVDTINLVGKARIIFFSNDKKKGSFFKFWKWNQSIRAKRFFKKII